MNKEFFKKNWFHGLKVAFAINVFFISVKFFSTGTFPSFKQLILASILTIALIPIVVTERYYASLKS